MAKTKGPPYPFLPNLVLNRTGTHLFIPPADPASMHLYWKKAMDFGRIFGEILAPQGFLPFFTDFGHFSAFLPFFEVFAPIFRLF